MMEYDDYHAERVKLQKFQAKLQLTQIVIQAATLLSTLILLGSKL